MGQDVYSGTLRHYRSLFTLPSPREILLLHMLTGMLFGFMLHDVSALGLFLGLLWVTIPSILADGFTFFLTRGEPVLRLRRLLGLSLCSNAFWLAALTLGKFTSSFTNDPELLTVAYTIGFSASLALRFIVFSAVTFMKPLKNLGVSMFQPSLCLLVFYASSPLDTSPLFHVLVSASLMLFSTHIFLSGVDGVAKGIVGFGSLELLRAFLANWMEDLGKPLEDYFERIGTPAVGHIGFVAFGKDRGSQSMLVIPYVHPGPFKNVGSSALPSLIQERLGRKNALIVSVPHGPSGHERNLTSQAANEKVLKGLEGKANFNFHPLKASRMVRATVGEAKASCQRFNDIALVTFTLAPGNMEDIPAGIGEAIARYGKALGFETVFVVDAHNSTRGSLAPTCEEATRAVEEAAVKALSAVISEPLAPAKVGAFKLCPREFDVREGMGPGGLVATVIAVSEQTVAYITVDGNNMVSTLRERILSRLRELGVSDGEVLTTDTHTVNATVTGPGYHPVGEVMDNEKLIAYIYAAVREAMAGQEEADMAWDEFDVEDIKVFGSKNVTALTSIIEASIGRAKRLALAVFPITVFLILGVFATSF